MGTRRRLAIARDDPMVGSPPRIRSIAPATTAAWKKMPIAYAPTYMRNNGT
jgi:hypothetical protein